MEIAHVFFRSEAVLASPAKERGLVSRNFSFPQKARRSWFSSLPVSASSGSPSRSVSSRPSPGFSPASSFSWLSLSSPSGSGASSSTPSHLMPRPSSCHLSRSASSARFSSPRGVCASPCLRPHLGEALAAAEPATDLGCTYTPSRPFCISYPSPKKLSDVVKLPLLRLKSREEIAEIWAEHFHSKTLSVAASTAHDTFERVAANAQVAPHFVVPLPRGEGGTSFETFFIQFQGPRTCLVTSLHEYTQVATALRCRGIPAQAYHAGLSDKVRCELQRGWMEGNIRVLVATVAFGLGVDNPHVRFVFHHSLPKTMEGYYQESGRCGRDGRPAHALLYYSPRNFESLRYIMDYTFSQLKLYSSKGRKPNARTKKGAGNRQEGEGEEEPDSVEDQKARLEHMERRYQKDLQSLKEVRKYCEETGCRRACILKFFGETVVPRRGFAKPSGRRESSKDPSKKRHRDAAEESEATSCRSFNRAKTEEKLSVHSGSADTAFVSQGNRNVSDGESLVACVRKRAPSCSDRVGAGFSEVKLGNNQNGENLKKNLCSDESDGGACLDAWRCCDLCEESKEGKTNGGGLPGKGHLTSAPSASVLASLNSRGCTRVSSASRRAPRSFAGGGMAAVAGEDDGGVLARGTLEFEKDDSSGEESGGDSRWCGAAKSFTGATTLRTGSSWYTHTSVMPRGLMASARGKRSEHCRSAGTGASGGGRVVYHTSAGSAFCRQSGVTKGQGTPSLKSGRVTDAVRAKGLRAVMEELERQEQLAEEEEDEGKKSRFFRQKFAAVRRSSSEADTPASRSCPLPFRRPRPASLGPASRKTACGMPLSNQPARSLAFVRASALPRDPTKSGAVAAAPLKSGLYHPRGKG